MVRNEELFECSGHGGFPYPNILAFIGPGQNYDPGDKNLERINQYDETVVNLRFFAGNEEQ